MTEPHTAVHAVVTMPTGQVSAPIYIGSMPTWAAETPAYLAAWKKARRIMALDRVGTSGDGCRVTYTLTPEESD